MSVPLLVFLHGLGQTPQSWQDQITALPAGTRAVAPWLEGLRPGRPADFDLEKAADAVLAQLNRFGVDRAALTGSGLGAAVAIAAAGRSPDAVSHLVLSDPMPRTPRLAGALQRLAVRAMPAGRLADAGLDRSRMIELMKVASGIDVRRWLAAVTARTLVVAGSQPAIVAAARELADGIPEARLETVPEAGAFVPQEAPATFNELLYEFLG
ncbi:MAG: alpha/beta fold hydrolase [Propionibacterium sp.]|nr:alpha/beta fold hydrolase [Propionibacterium sp.]